MIVSIILLGLGFFMLVKGSDYFVEGASKTAIRFHIPQLVIGLTIVAMGTSAPEAAVSIAAALKGNADITIGNILGSNILNILIILGISSIISSLKVAKSTVYYEIPFMIMITLLLLLLGMDHGISLMDGALLFLLFLCYLGYLFYQAKQIEQEAANDADREQLGKLLFISVLGLLLIVLGSNIAVEAASRIAREIGMSERFIALTMVALGTSLPELFTSIAAARKGNAAIAIGNIVGSNIFNILFVIGLSAIIISVPFSAQFYLDAVVAIMAGALLLVCSIKKRRLNRTCGVLMLICYLWYFIAVC